MLYGVLDGFRHHWAFDRAAHNHFLIFRGTSGMNIIEAAKKLLNSFIDLITPFHYTRKYLDDDDYIVIKTKGGE